MLKRLISGVLSVLVCSSMMTSGNVFNRTDVASNEKSANNQSDYELKAQNSFADYIVNAAESYEEDNAVSGTANPNSGVYAITNLSFDNVTGNVIIRSTQSKDCKAVIRFTNEVSGELALETTIEVKSGEKEETITSMTNVDVTKLPEYYYVTAELIDDKGKSLSSVYTQDKYTKEMQEILAADIHDFDEELVVNLDENENTNFVVLNEETVIAESTEDVNKLASADYDNGVYVFDNADETIKNLENGEFFYIHPTEGDIIALSVDSVEINENNQAVIKANDEPIDDMFDFIKIESSSDMNDTIIDTSVADEGVTFPELDANQSKHNLEDGEALNFEYSQDKMLKFNAESSLKVPFGFGREDSEYTPWKDIDKLTDTQGGFSTSVDGSLEITAKLNFYKKLGSLKVDLEVKAAIKVTAKAGFAKSTNSKGEISDNPFALEFKIAKFTITTSVPGILIDVEPKVVVELSAKIEFTVSTSIMFGFTYDSDSGLSKKSETKPLDYSLKIEGTLEFKLLIDPAVVLVSRKIAYIAFEASAGIKFTLKSEIKADILDKLLHSSETGKVNILHGSNEKVHGCKFCLNGDISFVASAGVKCSFIGKTVSATLLKITVPIGAAHCSVDTGFGWGTCDYSKYRINFNVFEQDSKAPINGVNITLDGLENTTNSSGVATYYGANTGTTSGYYYTAKIGDKTIESGYIKISDACHTEKIEVPTSVDPSTEEKTYGSGNASSDQGTKHTTAPDKQPAKVTGITYATAKPVITSKILESGELGKNITYTLHDDGYLWIYGHGKMYNFTSSPFLYPDKVKTVDFEHEDSANGLKITNIGNYVFYNCRNLPEITIPSTITSIGAHAFSNCSSLTEFKIPKAVKTVGDYAFSNTGYVNVTIPNTITTLGDFVFANCTSLKSAVIQDGISNIGNYLFSECSAFESVTMPYIGSTLAISNGSTSSIRLSTKLFNYSVTDKTYWDGNEYVPYTFKKVTITGGTRIPSYAFYNLTSLETVVLPNTVKTIADHAFYNCSSLKNITYSSNLKTISDYAFYGCKALEKFSVPSTVKTIGEYAFARCTKFTTLTVPGTIDKLANYAFADCTALETAVIKNGVDYLGDHIFSGCSTIKSITVPFIGTTLESAENATGSCRISTKLFNYSVTDKTYWDGNEYVPYTFTTLKVTGGTRIPDYSFYNLSYLTNIIIPDTVTSIGEYAFYNCSSLSSFTLPSSLKTIKQHAFDSCKSFTTFSVPASLKTIGAYAFANCTGYTSVTVPGTVSSLGENVFADCTALKTAVIKDGVGYIGNYLFNRCTAITNITLPYLGTALSIANLEESSGRISTKLFYSSVTDKTYSDGNVYVPYTFKKLTITGGTRVPSNAFCNLTSLQTVILPDTMTSIGESAFYNCSSLPSFTLPSKLEIIGESAFEKCTAFKTFSIPASVKTIGKYAFAGCTGYTSVTIPKTVVTLGDYVFSDCTALKTAVIKDGVGYIGNYLFNRCTAITNITLPYLGTTLSGVNNPLSSGRVSTKLFNSSVTDKTYWDGNVYVPYTFKKLTVTGGTRVPNNALRQLTSLQTVILPDAITSIGELAFYNCTSLPSFQLPSKLEVIEANAFENCSAFTVFSIPSSVKTIGEYAFASCNGFTRVTVPGTVVSLESYAFYNCTSLKTAIIEDGIGNIGDYLFDKCIALESITLPFAGTSLESANKGTSAIYLSNKLFYHDVSDKTDTYGIPYTLKKLAITGGTRIPNNAFRNFSNVTGITLPKNIKSVGENAFYGCNNLSRLTFVGNAPTFGENAFYNVTATVYYPKSNSTWTSSVRKSYGGSLTWKAISVLSITKQPSDVQGASGSTVTASVTATGEGLTYQWYTSADGAKFSKSSVTKASYSFTLSSSNNGRKAYCVVKDKYGNTVTTKTITFTISNTLKITKQPVSASAAVGSIVKATVTATGEGLTYTWYYCNPGNTTFSKSSVSGDTYSYEMTAEKSGRKAYCVITDKNGNSVTSETVSFGIPVKITKQPASASAEVGSLVKATVTAAGEGLKYQWYVCNPGSTTFSKSSISGDTYSYEMTAEKSGRKAYCVITDKYGNSVTSKTVTFTMASALKITKQPVSASAEVGSLVKATVTATGEGLTYTWYYCNPGSTTFSKSSISSNTYSYEMTAEKSGRKVYCVITDKNGNSVTSKTVSFGIPVKITKQPASASVAVGSTVKATVTATGEGLTYTWYYCNPGNTTFSKSSVSGDTYSYEMTAEKSGRKVYCEITDKYGNTVKSKTITFTKK